MNDPAELSADHKLALIKLAIKATALVLVAACGAVAFYFVFRTHNVSEPAPAQAATVAVEKPAPVPAATPVPTIAPAPKPVFGWIPQCAAVDTLANEIDCTYASGSESRYLVVTDNRTGTGQVGSAIGSWLGHNDKASGEFEANQLTVATYAWGCLQNCDAVKVIE